MRAPTTRCLNAIARKPTLMPDRFGLEGRKALITGASSGLGRHFALTLAKAGATVIAAARRADKLADLVKELQALGASAHAVSMTSPAKPACAARSITSPRSQASRM
jgi:NAD(P)-dependent dehydrogenase (short-subunit alcohol dehydrogenase family)